MQNTRPKGNMTKSLPLENFQSLLPFPSLCHICLLTVQGVGAFNPWLFKGQLYKEISWNSNVERIARPVSDLNRK